MSRTVTPFGSLVLAVVGSAALALGAVGSDAPRPGVSPSASVSNNFTPASFRFAKSSADRPETAPLAPTAPIRLTASDGTGLSLVAIEANGVLEPPLALTELRLTFENPRDEIIEGRFRITLPPGATLSRFAMKIGDAWQEGEVVERQRARQVYEDFLHRKQDPALLEQEAGNEFSARVFPIPARGRKELIVSYSHALTRADDPYVIPLLGLPEIGQLDVRVLLGERSAADAAVSNLGGEVNDRRMVELHKQAWTPDRDFEIGQDRVASRTGLRHANLAVVRVAPAVDAAPQEIEGLYVLVDSSASRALGYAAQVRRISELIAGLRDGSGGATPLGVAAFDQEVVPIFEGQAGGFGAAEVRRLEGRRALGASDLHGALAWLAARLEEGGEKFPRILLLTDGVATAGETETRALKAAVRALGARGVERLDVLAVGGLRDEAVLRELATGNLEHDGQRIDGDAPLSEIGRRLTLACRSGIRVEVEGAGWVWPETLDGIQPGDEVLVHADLPAGRPLRLTLGGQPVQLADPVTAERLLLERSWVQARIDRMMHLRETAHAGDNDLRQAIGREVTELSVRHRVLTPFTALLVLETEDDYVRFGLDRRALGDILAVGPGGLEVIARMPPGGGSGSTPDVRAKASRRVAPPTETEVSGAPAERIADLRADEALRGVEGVPGGASAGMPSIPAPPSPPPPLPRAAMAPPELDAEAPLRMGDTAEPLAEQIVVQEPRSRRRREQEEKEEWVAPYTGRFAEVMRNLSVGRVPLARSLAETWSAEEPGDVLALLALGETWEAAGETAAAARAYGSLIDLFPSRADLRRLAGERLEGLGDAGLELAADTYAKAALDRPDHPTGHRLLAWALLRAGRFEAAFAALEHGLRQSYPDGRFAGVDHVLREELGLLAAAWLRAEPARREEVLERLRTVEAELESEPSLRFVLTWETDANDVDLHVYDRQGGHAYYSEPELPSGGELNADVTTGYGPESFVVRGAVDKSAAPYRLRVHYYNRGPMGFGMGTVQILRHDGEGRLSVESRPFVVMADDAMVELGTVAARRR
jgi:tetratricopeptide (TPR) repeat protein